jgi:hypothetical protein
MCSNNNREKTTYISFIELEEAVKTFFKGTRNKNQFLVACKSKEAETLLDNFDIPNINIIDHYGATHKKINRDRLPCNLHNSDSKSIHCSLNIILDMEKYIYDFKHGKFDVAN